MKKNFQKILNSIIRFSKKFKSHKTISTECASGLFPTLLGSKGLQNLCLTIMTDVNECLYGLESFRSSLTCVLIGPVERDESEIRINMKFQLTVDTSTESRTYRVLSLPTFYGKGKDSKT